MADSLYKCRLTGACTTGFPISHGLEGFVQQLSLYQRSPLLSETRHSTAASVSQARLVLYQGPLKAPRRDRLPFWLFTGRHCKRWSGILSTEPPLTHIAECRAVNLLYRLCTRYTVRRESNLGRVEQKLGLLC